MHSRTHADKPFYGSWESVWDNIGEPAQEETFTHSHLSWSSVIPYLLPPSLMIHGILPLFNLCAWQFLTQFLSKFLLVCLLAWHHPLCTPYISSSNHCLLFAARAHTIATSSNPTLSLNPLLETLSCSLMLHIHLTILVSARWSATSFSFLVGQDSHQCNIQLRTQLLYNLPITINDISLLVTNGTNCQPFNRQKETGWRLAKCNNWPEHCRRCVRHQGNKSHLDPWWPDSYLASYMSSSLHHHNIQLSQVQFSLEIWRPHALMADNRHEHIWSCK